MPRVLAIVTALLLALPLRSRAEAPNEGSPERRALNYLAREVPRWSRENHCFSCHNNGDGARTLLAVPRIPGSPTEAALADTLGWLARPERWDKAEVDAAFRDERLARLQFTVTLAAAVTSGRIRDRTALGEAARRVAADQEADGSWPMGADGTVGSPTTYGRPLATALARQALAVAGPDEFVRPIAKADQWLRNRPIVNVLDASAVLLGLPDGDPADRAVRRRCLDLIVRAEAKEGGWGPFLHAPPEPFDTALVLLALNRWKTGENLGPMLQRGRAYLIAAQTEDGSWPETTRPAGGESYAQQISTTGWATRALLATGSR